MSTLRIAFRPSTRAPDPPYRQRGAGRARWRIHQALRRQRTAVDCARAAAARASAQVFYTIRSERQLMEQLHYNLLYRWFVGLGVDEPVWVPTVFTKNRERLLTAEVAHKFLAELLNHKQVRGLLSDEHFSVDGTQVAAWTSVKSFRAKDGSDEPPSGGRNGERDFHGEKPSNDTHSSTTDPEARLYRKGKGKEAKLSYIGNALTENRHVLVVAAELGSATGTIEREAAVTMVVRHSPGSRRLTLGADKAYDVHGFVDDLRDLNV